RPEHAPAVPEDGRDREGEVLHRREHGREPPGQSAETGDERYIVLAGGTPAAPRTGPLEAGHGGGGPRGPAGRSRHGLRAGPPGWGLPAEGRRPEGRGDDDQPGRVLPPDRAAAGALRRAPADRPGPAGHLQR